MPPNNFGYPAIVTSAIASFALALLFLIGSPSFAAAENVASIGDAEYNSLQEAIDGSSDGDTILLLRDVKERIIVTNKRITIDLNGNIVEYIQQTGNEYSVIRVDGGEVIIKNGTLRGGRGGGNYRLKDSMITEIEDGGTLQANNGTVTAEDIVFTKGEGSSILSNHSNMTVRDCTIENNIGYSGSSFNIVHLESGDLKMEKTRISGNSRSSSTLAAAKGAKAILNGCEISGNSSDYYYAGSITVGLCGEGDLTLKDTVVTGNQGSTSGGVYVSGGRFVMENSAVSDNYTDSDDSDCANDINVAAWSAGSYIQKADEMNGDYEHFVWDNKTEKITTDISYEDGRTLPLTLTAVKDDPNDPVAEYNGQIFNTLSGAVTKAIEDNATDKADKQVKLLKDTKDSVSIPRTAKITGTLDVDLAGFTVSGKDQTTPIIDIAGGGTGIIRFHDGKLKDGRSGSTYRTQGGGLRFFSNDTPKVTFKNVDMDNCHKITLNVQTDGDLILDNCNITHSEGDYENSHAMYIRRAGTVTLTGCTFENNTAAIMANGQLSQDTTLLVENSKINNNRSQKKTSSKNIVDIGFNCRATIRNSEIRDNYNSQNASYNIINVESEGSLTVEGCIVSGNETGYSLDNNTGTVKVDGNLSIIDTQIRNNKAGAAGGILQEPGSTNATIHITNSIIEGNTARGRTYADSSGGGISGGIALTEVDQIGFRGDLYLWEPIENMAIYNNKVETVPEGEYKANDIYVGPKAALTQVHPSGYPYRNAVFKASEMKDGDTDFSNKVWKDEAVTGYDENPKRWVDETRYYTVVDRNNVSSVASIDGKGEFMTLAEAVDAAEPGETVELIADETYVMTDEVEIDKDITIDLKGHNIRLKRDSSAESPLKVSNGAVLSLANNVDEGRNDAAGIENGGVYISEGCTFRIGIELKTFEAINHGSLLLDKVPDKTGVILGKGKTIELGDDVELEGKSIKVTLDDETAEKFNNANQTDADAPEDLTVIENVTSNMPDYVDMSNITSGKVVKRVSDGNMVISVAKAVYIDGEDGNDADDGNTPDAPVRTFDQARKELEEKDLDYIIVVDTVVVRNTQEWDLGGKEMIRYRDNGENLILVSPTGDLTLRDIVIDGRRFDMDIPCKSIVKVEKGGKLTVDEGTELKNNDIRKNTLEKDLRGGAIDSAGDVTIKAGRLYNNVAALGGAVYQSGGTLDFTGGEIDANETVYRYFDAMKNLRSVSEVCNGGGVMLGYGAVMNMSGNARVTNNKAEGSGGGIALGCRIGNYTHTRYSGGKATTINLTGGTIDGNRGAAGGGITVQDYAVANVGMTKDITLHGAAVSTAGKLKTRDNEAGHIYITNNVAIKSSAYIAGAGIYVNGTHVSGNNYTSGVLNIKNVELTGNASAVDGAAIGTCSTSELYMRDIEGALIYDNRAYAYGASDTRADEQNQVALTGRNMSGDIGWDELVMRGDSTVSRYMLGGDEYDWRLKSGRAVSDDEIDTITNVLYLSSDISGDDEAVAKGKDLATVHINNNSAINGAGGGIGTNGLVYIGSYRDYKDITVEKKWNDDITEFPPSIRVILKQDGKEYKTAVIERDSEGNWPKYTFEKLPVYKLDTDGAQTSTKHDYTIQEDYSYIPSGSERKIGDDYVSIVEQGETTTRPERDTEDPEYQGKTRETVNYTITNMKKPEEILLPCNDDPPVAKLVTGDPERITGFEFVMKPLDEVYPMPEGTAGGSKTITIQGQGKKEFGVITFDQVGSYDYEVTEKIPDGADGNLRYGDYTYDDSRWRIHYDIINKDGQLEKTRTYYRNGEKVSDIEAANFINRYTPDKPGGGDEPGGGDNPNGGDNPGGGDDPGKTTITERTTRTGDAAMIGAVAAAMLIAAGAAATVMRRRRPQ